MMARKSGYSQYSPESNPDCPCERGYWEDTACDGYDPLGQFGGESAFGCGTLYPLGEDDGLWFHEVTGIYWRGLVPNWYGGCDGMPGCSSDCSFGDTLALPPAIPGYGFSTG